MKHNIFWAGKIVGLLIWAMNVQATPLKLDVNLDTTPLIGGVTAPYYLEFQLIDGDGIANTSIDIGSFAFGGGSALSTPTLDGDTSGDLNAGLTLNDTSFFNAFYQEFQPGSSLSFSILLENPTTDPLIPDRLTFAILNNSLFEIPTSGAGSELLGFDIRTPLQIEVYAGIGGTNDPILDAPVVTTVPEPSVLSLLAFYMLVAAKRNCRNYV